MSEPVAVLSTAQGRTRWADLVPGLVAVTGAAACALSAAAPALRGVPYNFVATLTHVTVAASFIGAGVVARVRRPDNGTWSLMAGVGLLWLINDLYWFDAALPFTIAAGYEMLYQAVLGHLFLAFPTGRVRDPIERRLVIASYVWTLLNNLARMLVYNPRLDCRGCPHNLLYVVHAPVLWRRIDDVTTDLSIVIVALFVAVITRHWRRASRASRRVMAPALWALIPAATYLVLLQVAEAVHLAVGVDRFVHEVLPIGLAVLPIGFLLGLLRTRLSYAGIAALLPELSAQAQQGRVRERLADFLHDPTLELWYWSPTLARYVDTEGRPVAVEVDEGRTLRTIDGGNGPLAAVVVDDAVMQEPTLLDTVAAVARLALENEQLHAEVRSQLLQLREATARLVDTSDHARRRLERDLHDGAQQRLLSLAMTLGRVRAGLNGEATPDTSALLDAAASDLQQAISELRELARGIHPVLLTQEGVASALRALADRVPVPMHVDAPPGRFSAALESTVYFIVSEAVTNTVRYAGATRVDVLVRTTDRHLQVRITDDGAGGAAVTGAGSGVQGMRDRATAAGGTFALQSLPGAGTTVTARLPCA